METVVGILGVLAMKLAAILAGYKIVALGHDTLVRGIKGEFDFSGGAGSKNYIKLKSASPGLLFVLLVSLLIGWAIFVQKPVSYYFEQETTTKAAKPVQPETMK